EVPDDRIRCPERELELAERFTGDHPDVVLVSRLERAVGCLPRRVGATQLRADQTLERDVVPGEQRLPRLLRRLAPLPGMRARGLEVAEEALHIGEQEEEPRQCTLVSQLVRASHQVEQDRVRLLLRIDPLPVLGEGYQG